MTMRITLAVALLLASCARGGLDQECNKDGTCNSPALTCSPHYSGFTDHTCQPAPKPLPAPSCHGDADCFCEQCLKRCGDVGVKTCAYTDVSVWGSKPTICECRQ